MNILKGQWRRMVSRFTPVHRLQQLTPYEWILGISMASYAVVFSVYLTQKYEFFRTGYFDFGSYVQQIWLASHGHLTSFTLGRPINIITAGLYALFPRPETLLVFQSFMLAFGALPLYSLALRELGRRWYAMVFALLYLISPFLWGVNQYEYHDMAMVIPLFLFAFYFYATGNRLGYLSSLTLALFSSELVVVIGIFIGLSFMIDYLADKNRQKLFFALVTIAASILWAVYLELSILIPHYLFATLPPTGYTFTGSSQLLNPLTVLADPLQSVAYAWGQKFEYLIYLIGPFLFLPLLSLRKLVPSFPWMGVIVAYSVSLGKGGIGPVYQLYSNWSSFVLPFVCISAVYGLKRFSTGSKDPEADAMRLRQILVFMLIITAAVGATTGAFSPVSIPVNLAGGDSTVPTGVAPGAPYHGVWPTPVANYTVLNTFVSMIPANVTVMTQNVIGSKLAERFPPVYIFYQPGYKNVQTDLILIDTNVDGFCSQCMTILLASGNYTLSASYDEGGIYLYMRR